MARKKKTDTSAEDVADKDANAPDETVEETAVIEDAEVIEEIAPEDESTDESHSDSPSEETPTPDADADMPDDAPDAPPAQAQPSTIIVRKGGFFPLLLGGAAAALIGFGAARYVLPEGWPWPGVQDNTFEQDVTAKLTSQGQALAGLKAAQEAGPDLSGVTDDMAGLQSAVDTLAGRLGEVTARLDGIDSRIDALEMRPVTENASPAAVAAYERELKALQTAMATQRAEIEEIAKQAANREANAEITAHEAMLRAAVSRIQTALDTGTGFAEALDDLRSGGVTVPPALSQAAETGVDSMAALTDAFPEAARAALAVARKDQGGGIGAFLKTQLGARSLSPRDGDDADAVLSRVEAALRDGRLTDALAEAETLPESARAEMTDWLGRAHGRATAMDAAATLAAQVNSN